MKEEEEEEEEVWKFASFNSWKEANMEAHRSGKHVEANKHYLKEASKLMQKSWPIEATGPREEYTRRSIRGSKRLQKGNLR